MKIHLRVDKSNVEHVHLTMFMNGQNNGTLCMSPNQFGFLITVMKAGIRISDEFMITDADDKNDLFYMRKD